MRIKNKIVPTLTNLNLRNLNDIITEIFREINKVSKSAPPDTGKFDAKFVPIPGAEALYG